MTIQKSATCCDCGSPDVAYTWRCGKRCIECHENRIRRELRERDEPMRWWLPINGGFYLFANSGNGHVSQPPVSECKNPSGNYVYGNFFA